MRCDVGAFQTAAVRLKTEDFRGDPRSGSSARGFIGFGEGGGRDHRVVSEWFRNDKSSRSGKQLGGFVMRGLEMKSSMNLG